jgi:hypothetical protein
MNADRVIVGEVLGYEVLPMRNAMSQGRSGSMCTLHAESSAGVFRRIASYAVQAPERLPLEATNLLIAGALHFVVHLDSEMHDDLGAPDVPGRSGHRTGMRDPDGWGSVTGGDGPDDPDSRDSRDDPDDPDSRDGPVGFFPARGSRARFVSSVREVIDAEGSQVVSNEIYRPGQDRRAVPASPLRAETVDELVAFGLELPNAGRIGAYR